MIDVAITHYRDGEHTVHEKMPAVPRVGDVVFLGRELPSMHVRTVYWSKESEGWQVEVHLSEFWSG